MSVFIQQLLIVIYQKIKSESFVDSLKRFLGPELSVWPDLKLCIESGSRKGQVGVRPRVLVAGQELCDRNLKMGPGNMLANPTDLSQWRLILSIVIFPSASFLTNTRKKIILNLISS